MQPQRIHSEISTARKTPPRWHHCQSERCRRNQRSLAEKRRQPEKHSLLRSYQMQKTDNFKVQLKVPVSKNYVMNTSRKRDVFMTKKFIFNFKVQNASYRRDVFVTYLWRVFNSRINEKTVIYSIKQLFLTLLLNSSRFWYHTSVFPKFTLHGSNLRTYMMRNVTYSISKFICNTVEKSTLAKRWKSGTLCQR